MKLNYMEAGKVMSESNVSDALDLCREILDEIDDLPEAAEDFAASVSEKTLSIQEWIEDNEKATDNQMRALRNMLKGIRKWHR